MKTCNESGRTYAREITLPFTQVPNNLLQNKKISYRAKGIYCTMLSYINIPTYTVYKTVLQRDFPEGRTAFDSAWKELINAGYIIVHKINTHKGFVYEYEVLWEPECPNNGNNGEGTNQNCAEGTKKTLSRGVSSVKKNTECSVSPDADFPHWESPHRENEQLNNNNLDNNNLKNNHSFIDDVEKKETQFKEITNSAASLSLDDIFGAAEKSKKEYSDDSFGNDFAAFDEPSKDWMTRAEKAKRLSPGYESINGLISNDDFNFGSETKYAEELTQNNSSSFDDFRHLFQQKYSYKTVNEDLISKKLAREDEAYEDDPHWKNARNLLLRVFKSFGKDPEAVSKINNIDMDDLSNLANIAYDMESGALKIRSSFSGYLASTIRNMLGF